MADRELTENGVCPDHPGLIPEAGYGLAGGGGIGVYTVCPACCRVLTKWIEPDEWPKPFTVDTSSP